MPIVRVLHRNYGIDAAVWGQSSQVSTLPSCHLSDGNRQKAWRSTGAGTSDWAAMNLCSTTAKVDRVGFVNYNFTTCAFLGIEGDCTSAFNSGSAFTTCFTPWAAARTRVCFVDLSARQTGKKWWRFVACDTGVDDGYYEVGVFTVGQATCMIVGAGDPVITYTIEDPSLVEYAPAGTPKTWQLDPYVVIELPHRFLTEALVFGDFQDVLRSGGRREDMLLSVYTSAPACTCAAVALNLYGRFEEQPHLRYALGPDGATLWDATLRFRESL